MSFKKPLSLRIIGTTIKYNYSNVIKMYARLFETILIAWESSRLAAVITTFYTPVTTHNKRLHK